MTSISRGIDRPVGISAGFAVASGGGGARDEPETGGGMSDSATCGFRQSGDLGRSGYGEYILGGVPCESEAAKEPGKLAETPPVALWAYLMARTERIEPKPALVAEALEADERSKNLGTDREARMPMMAITMTSSMRVKP